jgi:hypothetical protein
MAYNEVSVIIRSSGGNVFHACLIYRTSNENKAYLAVESGQTVSTQMAMMSLLEQTAARVERTFEARVFRSS